MLVKSMFKQHLYFGERNSCSYDAWIFIFFVYMWILLDLLFKLPLTKTKIAERWSQEGKSSNLTSRAVRANTTGARAAAPRVCSSSASRTLWQCLSELSWLAGCLSNSSGGCLSITYALVTRAACFFFLFASVNTLLKIRQFGWQVYIQNVNI